MNDLVPKAGDFIVQQRGGKEIRKFRKIRLIGKGGFAEVYQCHDSKTDQEVAVKVLSREKISKINGAREKLMTEVSIHKSMDHPNIVKFEEFFEDYYHFYIVLELCTDENLESRLKREKSFSDEDTIIYMKQLLDALIYIRNKKVIHRDLKLANLFVKEGKSIKLGDFGLACKHENPNRKRKSVCGTPNYIAPEILSGEGHTYPVDVWAVGILLYAMLIGKPPFETTNIKSTYNRIQSCMYVFPSDVSIDQEAKALIMKILTKHANKRPTYEAILECSYFSGECHPSPVSHKDVDGTEGQAKAKVTGQMKLGSKPQFTQKVPLKKMTSYRRQPDESSTPKVMDISGDNGDFPNKDSQPILERQKFYKKLFSNEFRSKMGSETKLPEMNQQSYRAPLSKKDTLISKDEVISAKATKSSPKKFKDDPEVTRNSDKKPVIEVHSDANDVDNDVKEQESSILKRIMTKMTNTANEDNPEEATDTLPQSCSEGNLITKKFGISNKLAAKVQVNEGQNMGKRGSLVVEPQDTQRMRKGSATSNSLAPPESSSKKISAFDIIKNSSRVDSLTNSMIADEGSRRDLQSATKQQPSKEIDTKDEGKSKAIMERESSVQSASNREKRMLFQKMIDDRVQRGSHKNDTSTLNNLKLPGSVQGQIGRTRAASVRVQDADNKLIKTLFEGDTVVSPSNAEDISPENRQESGNERDKQERSSSAQPAVKMRSLWQTREENAAKDEAFDPGDYVKKWIDHSAKYGLVSIMHSGIVSILFNDMTKAIFRINGEKFVYLSRSQSKQREEVRIFPLELPPRDFEKKMCIIKDIIRTLGNYQKDLNLSGGSDAFLSSSKDRVHVKNWVKAKQVIVFKLSSGVYQAIFQDKSELLFSSKNERFIFVDKDRTRYSHTLNSNDILKNRSVNVRVEYFKRVLKKWIERDSANTHLPSRVNHDLDI